MGVVDGFEAIEVQKAHRQPVLFAARTGHGLGQAIGQQGAVGQACERVEMRLALQVLLVVFALGDVREHVDVVRHLAALVRHRVDGAGRGVQTAIAAPVPKFTLPMASLVQRLPHQA